MALNTRMPYYMLMYYRHDMAYNDVLLSTLLDSLSLSLTYFLLGRERKVPSRDETATTTRTTRTGTTITTVITTTLSNDTGGVASAVSTTSADASGTAPSTNETHHGRGHAYASGLEAFTLLALLSAALHAILTAVALSVLAAPPRPGLAGDPRRAGALMAPAAVGLAAFALAPLAPLPPWPPSRGELGGAGAASPSSGAAAKRRQPPGVIARGAILAAAAALDTTVRVAAGVEGTSPVVALEWSGAFAGVTLAASAVLAWVVADGAPGSGGGIWFGVPLHSKPRRARPSAAG